jgi:pantetheine-phosphate adenylyltransferase
MRDTLPGVDREGPQCTHGTKSGQYPYRRIARLLSGARTRERRVRVIAGELRGRRLYAPRSGVRPTSDRVREALFALLGSVSGARVLDLYAGTGALGIEALSRGAEQALFIERAPGSLAALRRNLDALALGERARVVRADARAGLARLEREGAAFDLVFADPPYAAAGVEAVLASLVERHLLRDGAVVVVERGRRHPLARIAGLALIDERSYGDTVIARLGRDGPGETERATRRLKAQGSEMSETTERRVALFPASFDPLTNGHLDIALRARRMFHEVVLGLAINVDKSGTFSVEERLEVLETVTAGESGLRVTSFTGLTVDYAREVGAQAIIRGVRAMSDFEYEFEMALMNKHLNEDVETLFMMPSQQYLYVSSSRLKELARFGRDVQEFVPPQVAKMLRERFAGS